MRLIVDQNIPHAEQAFSQFGDVELHPGRTLTPAVVADADILIVRSVTKVNEALLGNSRVRFVGTATIGTDHLDIPWLAKRGIGWSSAQGCNANSVVEWVMAGLAEYGLATGRDWRSLRIGIVGHGNIGSRLAARCHLIGMQTVVSDPPLHREGRLPDHQNLRDLLPAVDVVSFHVPLVREGPDRTIHLAGEKELALLPKDAVVMNASRGDVIATDALIRARKDLGLIIDVFEGEPEPSKDVIERCFLVSPHVAGYSYEGKVNGTRMMADAVATFLGTQNSWAPTSLPPDAPVVPIVEGGPLEVIAKAIRHSYDIGADDQRLRAGLGLAPGAWGEHFDQLRRNYPKRREFRRYNIEAPLPAPVRGTLMALGFQLH
ncbi:DUF3410 domain-containing protein [bacterium]|nr:DUF3410 domain-containing protein [bacterium]